MRAALIALCLMLVAGTSYAESIYRWTGADGRVQYGDLPPGNARNVQKLDSRLGNTTQKSPSPTEADTAISDTRRVDCAAKSAQLKTFKSAAKLVEKDNLGREREFTSEEKQLLIERTQSDLDTQCAGVAPEA